MRRVRRWRFYCEHCAKSGASGGHMAKHERSCTLNPERVCGMCKWAGDVEQKPMDELVTALRDGGMTGLRAAAESCPACILAAIRQDRLQRGIKSVKDLDDEAATEEWNRYPFDFKKESTEYLAEIARMRECY